MPQTNGLHVLLVEQLRDMYDAEKQITQALPKMIQAASDEKLREAFEEHLDVTRTQIERLERIFGDLGETAREKRCPGMAGIIKEGEEALQKGMGGPLLDALLIAGAQRVEHYEISAYGTARAWADELGLDDAADLLGESLDEESEADELLTSIAEGGILREGVNQEAAPRR